MKGLISKTIATLLMLAAILPAQAVEYTRVTYVHTDADGTPFAATDEEGNLEWSIEHMPFGAEHSNTEVRRKSNLSFVGRMYDEEIGLSYFGGRWYDPHAGRFTGIDPMPVNPEDWRTFNRYAYGNNNPYKYFDPDGNLPILIPLVMFLAKEGVAEVASRYTNGASDFLSVRRMGSKAVKKSLQILKRNKGGGPNGGEKKATKTIQEQALELKKLNNNKNTVTVQTPNKKVHYDLDGAAHKGIDTPHVQHSFPNTNPKTGETFFNKDRKATPEKMTQQDIRTVRKVLERRNR